jgi:hypothetical protein
MVSNSFLFPLTKLETTELSWFCSAWPVKIDDKLVWSRFLPIVTHTWFLHRTIVIWIFLSWKGFKHIYFALAILETMELSRFCSAWPEKVDNKLVWSRILPTVTNTRFLHRTIVIRIFFVPERFQTHFFHFYNIRNNIFVPILFRLTREIWWQTRTVTVSSYCDSHSLFALDDCNSNFAVPEWFQTHFFPLLQN